MNLDRKKVAILATNGFEQSELFQPMNALKEAGATIHIISDQRDDIKGWQNGNWGKSIAVDRTIEEANEQNYSALLLPGGVMNPDTLRMNENALNFIRAFFKSGKPVSAICHAPWLLASAGVLENRRITSYKSIKDDMINAGAKWVNEEVVTDEGLTTSRDPKDLPAFISKTIEEIKEGKHEDQMVNA